MSGGGDDILIGSEETLSGGIEISCTVSVGISLPRPRTAVIRAGTLVTITAGNYSDYSVHGVFRALADIDPDALVAEFNGENPLIQSYSFERAFLGWIAQRSLIEPVACTEWHLGDYDDTRGDWMSVKKLVR